MGAEDRLVDACNQTLHLLLKAGLVLPVETIRVRFQLLSAVQCWWLALDTSTSSSSSSSARSKSRNSPHVAPLETLRTVHRWAGEGRLPSAEESVEGQEWISTQCHAEVVQSLPSALLETMKLEEFAFPFWLDVVLPA